MKANKATRIGPRGLLALSILCLLSSQAAAFDVRISWEAVTQNTSGQPATIDHYVLYYGNKSRGVVAHPAEGGLSYDRTTNVANATEITVQGLDDTKTYFFALAAVDAEGAFSDFSGEAIVTKAGAQNPADVVYPDDPADPTNDKEPSEGGCGCAASGDGNDLALLLIGLFLLRRRCNPGQHQV